MAAAAAGRRRPPRGTGPTGRRGPCRPHPAETRTPRSSGSRAPSPRPGPGRPARTGLRRAREPGRRARRGRGRPRQRARAGRRRVRSGRGRGRRAPRGGAGRGARPGRPGCAARGPPLGLARKDGTGALLAAGRRLAGLLGTVAAVVTVRPGYQTAVAAALGEAADAVAVHGLGRGRRRSRAAQGRRRGSRRAARRERRPRALPARRAPPPPARCAPSTWSTRRPSSLPR